MALHVAPQLYFLHMWYVSYAIAGGAYVALLLLSLACCGAARTGRAAAPAARKMQ